jgi:uncharacterized protein YlxP (DUF503 family)
MYVAACRVSLYLPASDSLKDKRQVVRSLLQRLRNTFEIAAAEVEEQDKRQLAVLGLAAASGEAGHAEEVIEHAVRFIEETRPDVTVNDVQVELMTLDGTA